MSVPPHKTVRSRVGYGVDLQGDRTVVVRTERTRGRLVHRVVSAGDAADGGTGAAGGPVWGALPVRRSVVRQLVAPLAVRRKALRVLPTLLDIRLPFELESCITSFHQVAATGAGGTRALAVAARETDVVRELDAFRGRGFDLHGLDHEGLAIWTQAAIEAPPSAADAGALRVVVYSGSDRTAVCIGRGTELLAAHGLRTLDEAGLDRLLCAAVQEGRGGESSDSTPRVAQWICGGPHGADVPAVAALCRKRGGRIVAVDTPAAFLARAVSTRAMRPGPLRVNLRTGVHAHEGARLRSERMQWAAAVATLICGLALCAANVGLRLSAAGREQAVLSRVADKADRVAGYHVTARGRDAVDVAAEETAARMERLAPFVRAFEPHLVHLFARLLPVVDARQLEIAVLSLKEDAVQIRGSGPDWNSAVPVADLLRAQGYDAVLDREQAAADERIPFEIRGETGR